MAPAKKAKPGAENKKKGKKDGSPPAPFKQAPESLQPFYETLSPKHVYIAHVDAKPWDFKRKIFIVPVLMNVAITLLFMWRVYYIAPYYLDLIASTFGHRNSTTLIAEEMTWTELITAIGLRAFTFMLDLCLIIFVWPWPVEFCFARGGSPMAWRMTIGFRDKEIYVRRSREWDRYLGDVVDSDEGKNLLLSRVRTATSPMLIQDKTGYLTMNGEWDLDWGAMVHATSLVDSKKLALEAFRTLVLFHHNDNGWMSVDLYAGESAQEDERRRQIFAFREALASIGKEDVFFRWIEMIQFEASQPGGISTDKQVDVADKVKELFASNGIDFEEFWRESMATEGLPSM